MSKKAGINIFQKHFKIGIILLGILFVIFIFSQNFEFSLLRKKGQKVQKSLTDKCNEIQSIMNVKESVVKIKSENGEGTGFIIKPEGYVLTNFHVVENTNSPRVLFPDNTSVIGTVFNWDEQTDLAVLKVEKANLKALNFGDSDKLIVGQNLIAIGFPYSDILAGEASVTKGTFSAKRASDFEGIEFIQTDVALNPGNSGGPLINVCGEVVGINALSIAEAQGLGFAISSKTANSMSGSLIVTGPKQFQANELSNSTNLNFQDVVFLYYSFISIRQLEAAYDLFSTNFIQEIGTLDKFKSGYRTTLNVYPEIIAIDNPQIPSVYVKIVSSDLIGDKVNFRNFEGTWSLIQENGEWKLDDADILEIK